MEAAKATGRGIPRGVLPTVVFPEPREPTEGPVGGLADWYRHSSSLEARAARRDINAWYAVFPDRDGMLLGNLQGDSEIGMQQAMDELYVHHCLARSYQADMRRTPAVPTSGCINPLSTWPHRGAHAVPRTGLRLQGVAKYGAGG
jgi:hypothetical protein